MTSINDELETVDVDCLAFGVLGFDKDYAVRVYNRLESTAADLAPERVLGSIFLNPWGPA